MSKIFTRTFRVRWGEWDPSGAVSPANYLCYAGCILDWELVDRKSGEAQPLPDELR